MSTPSRIAAVEPTVTIAQSSPCRGARCRSAVERVAVAGVDRAGRSEQAGLLPPRRRRVDREDLGSAADACTLDRVDADPACTDHRPAASGRDVDRLERGAHPGDDGAPDERGNVGRHAVGQRDDAAAGDDGVFGEAPEQRVGGDGLRPAENGVGAPVVSRASPIASSESWQRIGRPATQCGAGPAAGRHVEDGSLADRNARNARADRLDDARLLRARARPGGEAPTRRRPDRHRNGRRRHRRSARAPRPGPGSRTSTVSIRWGSPKACRTAAVRLHGHRIMPAALAAERRATVGLGLTAA